MSFKKTILQKAAVKLMGGNAKYLLLYGGSRSGKTFIIIRQIILRCLKEGGSRHLCVRLAFNHAKQSLWYDTIPKCLELCFPGVKPIMNKSDWFIEFANGSQIWVGGLDDKERTEKILGNEYCTIFYNEISQISWSSYATTVTRLAQKTNLVNKIYCDCNPPSKLHWSYKLFVEHKDPISNEAINPDLYAYLRLNPDDNKENLPDDYIESVLGTLSTRMQKRFRYGEFSDDTEGALWTYDMIDKNRVSIMPQFTKVIVGLDPSGSGKEGSDEAGIIVCGIDARGEGYVFHDRTAVLTPNQWGVEAIKAYYQWSANGIVAEVNQGWDMVEAVIRSIDKKVPVKKVVSRRGKALRADPIVALYEQGKVHHVGILPDLEDEMTTWDARESLKSPGRIDALVHALTDLMLGSEWEFLVA